MHRRLILAGLAATGGLLTSAFLQVAVAAADAAADVSATGADAFTIGGYTFDPFYRHRPGVEGWDPVAPLERRAAVFNPRRRGRSSASCRLLAKISRSTTPPPAPTLAASTPTSP